jgi:hypothetical protein
MQESTRVRNARLDAIEATIGASAVLKLRSGAAPANCAAADSGTVVASMQLPADYFSNAAAGVKSMLGTWQDTAADNTNPGGGAMHWRLYASDGTTCDLQGTVTVTGGGGEVQLQNLSINAGQPINITAFDLTAANA